MANNGDFLESSLPASIDIEEMLVGRITARQLGYLIIGAGIGYRFFKMSNHYIGFTMTICILIATYFLAFYKIKKYDRYLSEHLYFYWKYKKEQQVFLNRLK